MEDSIIAPLAVKVFNIPTNNILYERAFSIINFLENLRRNRFTADKIDIATFVYINSKKFKNLQQSFTGLFTINRDNLLLQIEEQLYKYI